MELQGRMRKQLVILLCLGGLLCWLLQGQPAQAAAYPRAVAHGCGAIQGDTVTNSQEALEQAIANGFRYIEVDMALTSDGHIAMLHDWESSASYYLGLGQNKAVSFAQYQQCRVLNRYTPLTMDTLARILQEHGDVRIITDTKEDNLAILTKIQKDYPQIVGQIIPQIYQYDQYDAVKALGYEQIILTLYKMSEERDGVRIAKFAQTHPLYAVTMSVELASDDLAKTLQSYGIAVYMHTVNSLQQTVTAINAGAYGIYTDTLLPQEVSYPGWQYYLARSGQNSQQLSIELQQGQLRLNMRTPNKTGSVAYYIGQQLVVKGALNQVLTVELSQLTTGQHTLTAYLYNGAGQQVATKQYLLWKDQSCALLLAPQCSYILEQFSGLGDFSQALAGQSQQVQQLAQKCFFARRGSAVYYNEGRTGLYLSGNTLLLAIAADSQGHIYTPLSDTALALGASSVQMNGSTKAMDITYQGKSCQAGIAGVTRRYRSNVPVLQVPVQLYRNRAMADGRFYQELTGRTAIQQSEYLILLPKGATATEEQKQALFAIAAQLYQ